MKLSRITLVLVAAIVLAAFQNIVVGYGQEGDESVRQSVENQLDGIKNLDSSALALIESGLSPHDASVLSQTGLKVKDFAKMYLDNFDYRIEDVKVEENKAQVEVVLSGLDFSSSKGAITTVSKTIASNSLLSSNGLGDLKKSAQDALHFAMSCIPSSQGDAVVLDYELHGSSWIPTSEALENLRKALLA